MMTDAERALLRLSDKLHDWGQQKLFNIEMRPPLEINIRLNYMTAKVRSVQNAHNVARDSSVFSQLIRSLLRFSKVADVGYIYGLAKGHNMSDWEARAEMWKERLDTMDTIVDMTTKRGLNLEDIDNIIEERTSGSNGRTAQTDAEGSGTEEGSSGSEESQAPKTDN